MKLQLLVSAAAVLFSAFSGSVSATSLRGVAITSDSADLADSADYYFPEGEDYDYEFDYDDEDEDSSSDSEDMDMLASGHYDPRFPYHRHPHRGHRGHRGHHWPHRSNHWPHHGHRGHHWPHRGHHRHRGHRRHRLQY